MADSYYHRAIYGRWDEDGPRRRLEVRTELVELLAKREAKEELLAELLPLQAEMDGDAATQAWLARLYLVSGAPARAAALFREILRARPEDRQAHAGLGEAELALGNYRTARSAFESALRLDPTDRAASEGRVLAAEVLAMDPLSRGVGSEERWRRTLRILEIAKQGVERCGVASESVSQLGEKARSLTKRRVPAQNRLEAIEEGLDLAEQLWQARSKCRAESRVETAVELVLAKAAAR
jgi:tetratricopeptide (TPR) repeat protein